MVMFCAGDGLIQHLELQHVMRACMEENGMRFSEDQVCIDFFSVHRLQCGGVDFLISQLISNR